MADNIYGDIMDSESQDQESSLRQSMFVASKGQPDAVASDLTLSQETGVPVDVVSRNKEAVQQAKNSDAIDYGYLIDNNPGLSKWLENTDNSAVAYDDIANLAKHEDAVKEYKLMDAMGRSLMSGFAAGDAAMARVPAALYDLAVAPYNLEQRLLGTPQNQVRSPEWLRNNKVAKYYDAQSEAWSIPELNKSITEQAMKGNYAGAGKTLVAQLLANAPTQAMILASAFAGAPAYGLGFAGLTTGATANKNAQESGVDPFTATTNALTQGSLEVLLERAGTLGVFRKWENAIAKSVGKQSAGKVMAEVGKTLAYSFMAEGNEEFLTQIGQDFTDFITGVNPMALQGTLQRAIDAGIIGGFSGATMTTPAATAAGMQRAGQARKAKQARDFYLALGESSKASVLRERLPDVHKRYVDEITKDGPVQNIYVPGDSWDTFFQSKGIDPVAAANEVGISQEYDQAKETGKDIKIPLSMWANKVVGTEYYQGLADDVKFNPEDLTVNQIKQQETEIKAELEKEAEAAQKAAENTPEAIKERADKEAEVQKIVEDQIRATGKFADKDVKAMAQLWSANAKAFGEKMGLDPMEFFSKNPLMVKAQDNLDDTQQDKQTMNQYAGVKSKTAPLDKLTDAQSLESSGASNESIRMQTGWFRGMDKKWRYEISDKDILLRDIFAERIQIKKDLQVLQEKLERENPDTSIYDLSLAGNEEAIFFMDNIAGRHKMYRLEEVYDHPKLYEAYPNLRNITVDFYETSREGALASYDTKKQLIQISKSMDPVLMTQNLVHEIQHAIQYYEDFATGGSVAREWNKIVNQSYKYLRDNNEEFRNLEDEYLSLKGKVTDENVRVVNAIEKRMDKIFYDYVRENQLDPWENYQKLAGEIEARDSAQRTYLSDKQRVENSPDVYSGYHTVVFGDKEFSLAKKPDLKLSALHNLSSENLEFAAKMGGIAVPSIAVVPEGQGMTGFGEITLIGNKDMADPRFNPVFDSDAYSPRFPKPEYKKAKVKDADRLYKEVKPFAVKFSDTGVASEVFDNSANRGDPETAIRRLVNSNAGKAWFLSTVKGINIEPAIKKVSPRELIGHRKSWIEFANSTDISNFNLADDDPKKIKFVSDAKDAINKGVSELFKEDYKDNPAKGVEIFNILIERYVSEDGNINPGPLHRLFDDVKTYNQDEVDRDKTAEEIDRKLAGSESEFKAWVEKKVLSIFSDPLVTVKGKKKLYTLNNIVDAMSGRVKGREATMTFGAGKARSSIAKKFDDLEQMRRYAEKNILPEDKVEAARAESEAVLTQYRDAVIEFYKGVNYRGGVDVFAGMDASMKALTRLLKGKRTVEGMRSALEAEYFNTKPISEKTLQLGVDAAEKMLFAPVPYFEAKPQRAVRLSEFPGAVIPNDASDSVKKILAENKIEFVEYEKGNDESRRNAINSLTASLSVSGREVLFQMSGQPTPEFKKWFGDSKVVDDNGIPLVVYHGSGTTITEFKPELTGQGNDQLGSGFYFTSDNKEAVGYSKQRLPSAGYPEKIGGEDNPNVIKGYLSIKNPIVIKEGDNLNDSGVELTLNQALKIIKKAPDLRGENSPLWNWFDLGSEKITDSKLREVADNYTGQSLISLENDFFKSDATAFRRAIYEVLGYDGVIKEFEDGKKHFVAFFPEQIKSVDNAGTFDPNNPNIFMQGGDPLGAIMFGKEGAFDMRLLKDMNYSTFLHETGHAFLEMLRRAATDQNPSASIQDMSKTTLEWFGVDSWDKVTRAHHEKWAQGFEKYLMEGNAPSQGLRAAFVRFRVWLISIYKTLTGLNVELSDEIRNVMNRMLATDDEIANAENIQNATQMFADPMKVLGEERGKRYIDAVNQVHGEAVDEMQYRLIEEYQRERKSWWMDELRRIRQRVAKDINARPEQIALSVLQRGRMPDGTEVAEVLKGIKIDTKSMVGYFARKFDIEVSSTDSELLMAEFEVEQLEEVIRNIDEFRKVAHKVRKYKDDYLAEELARIPKRYITTKSTAKTIDELALDMGFESTSAAIDKLVENEMAYKAASQDLIYARKELKKLQKNNRADKYRSIKESMKSLPRRINGKNGTSLEIVAQMFGYNSADEFVDVMSRVRDRNELISEISREMMVSQYGEVYGDKEQMAERAMLAVHNDKREQVLRLELEYLAAEHMPSLKDAVRTLSARIPTSQVAKKYAAEIVGKTRLSEISPYQFQLAERRMAKEAGKAFTQGKLLEAFEYKRKELLNYELYRAAAAARVNLKKSLEQFRELSKSDEKLSKTRDIDYINAGRSILAMYGLAEGSEDPYQYVKNVKEYDPDTYETLSALIENATEFAADYETITYDEFQILKQTIDALWEISRRAREIEIDGKRLELAEVRDNLIARIQELVKPGKKDEYARGATKADKFVREVMGMVAQGRRVESWTDLMDGEQKGWFTKAIWQPVTEGSQKFRVKNKEFTMKYLELVKPIEKSLKQREIVSDELQYVFNSKSELLGALLHTGNESNLAKLLRGRGWGDYLEDGTLDTARWDAFVRRMQDSGILTKQDYDFVQSVWDLFDEMKPAAQVAHKGMYGYYFDSISAMEFTTPWGKYRGGYAPAIADPFVSEDAAVRQEKEAAEKINNSFMFPTTGKGFTKKRVERYAAPLMMDLRLIPAHINKVLRFTYIEPHVKDVGRIIHNPAFRENLRDLDPTVGQYMLAPWLQRAAQQIVELPDKSMAGWRLWRTLRTRTGVNLMAANVVNTLQQFTGLSISAIKVKPKYLRNAFVNYIKNPRRVSSSIVDSSDFMKTRCTTHIIEINRTIDELVLNEGKFTKALEFAKGHAYFLQQGTQNIVDIITWSGAYDQAVAQGDNHDDAVRAGDSAVRLTQGDFSAENISNIEAGTAFARMFLMFYSYFNMQANLLGTEFTKVTRDMGLKKGAGRAIYIYTLGFMIPAVISELIIKSLSGRDWDDDDDGQYIDDILALFFGAQFKTGTAMFPFVGQTMNAVVNSFNNKWYDDDIRTSPAISLVEKSVKAPKDIYKAIVEGGSKKNAINDTLTLLGLITGLPTAPLAKPLGYASDVIDGNVYPDNAFDYARGLVTGRTGN